MLNERLNSVTSDMKVILNNRKKLDNLEDIIARFVKAEAGDHKFENNIALSGSNTISTKKDSLMFSRNSLNNENFNNIELPERDISSNIQITKVPKWYLKLRSKKE